MTFVFFVTFVVSRMLVRNTAILLHLQSQSSITVRYDAQGASGTRRPIELALAM